MLEPVLVMRSGQEMGGPRHGVTGGGLLGTWPELGAEDRIGSHLCHSHQQKRGQRG